MPVMLLEDLGVLATPLTFNVKQRDFRYMTPSTTSIHQEPGL